MEDRFESLLAEVKVLSRAQDEISNVQGALMQAQAEILQSHKEMLALQNTLADRVAELTMSTTVIENRIMDFLVEHEEEDEEDKDADESSEETSVIGKGKGRAAK